MSTSTRAADLRTDGHTGLRTFVVDSRQDRPNLPSTSCPFCPGGLEAPEAYDVALVPNRWPAMPRRPLRGRPLHAAARRDVLVARRRRRARRVVDLWAERSAALGARADVEYVLVFENRGADVGATITHPHGQIYAFELRARTLPLDELLRGGTSWASRATGSSPTAPGWRAWVPGGADLPVRGRGSCPTSPCRTCRRSTTRAATGWRGCSSTCSHASTGCSTQRRRTCSGSTSAPSTATTGRRRGCTSRSSRRGARPACGRYVAAGELGSGVYFNPVAPGGRGARAARRASERARDLSLDVAALRRRARRAGSMPELASLNRLPPSATLASCPVACAQPRRPLGVPARAAPRGAPSARAAARAAGRRSRCRGSGRCRDSGGRTTRTS